MDKPTSTPWLIWSNEHRAWWRPNSAGYTGDEAQAGRYTFVDAWVRCRDGGVPRAWSAKTRPYEVMVPAPEALNAMKALPALYDALAEIVADLPIGFSDATILDRARAALRSARGEA